MWCALDRDAASGAGAAEAFISEPETFQLFLKRRRENAERLCGASLVPLGREERGQDEASLEARQNISKNQAILARRFKVETRIEQRPFREVTRHVRQDRSHLSESQWTRN